MRGDKVGVLGPNGVGKTTFLNLLLGKLAPQKGEVRLGTNLQIAYFDQLRESLDPEATVQENVGEGYDQIEINGQKRHILGYLQDFQFSPARARTKIRFLSGGERNRILLAKLFAKPANVIVLDEPTNDLDYETLEMLEERLVSFPGTIIVVSHDRAFLNNVVTSTIVFHDGNVREYDGGYDDWARQVQQQNSSQSANKASTDSPAAKSTGTEKIQPAKKKLSYQEKRELDGLPEKIETIEREIAALHEQLAQPGFYQQGGNIVADRQRDLKGLEEKMAGYFKRWEELEAREG
jgi:ATP-binding cassette subfamily F protein uup